MIKWLKQHLPTREKLKKYRSLRFLGPVLQRKNLWDFHRGVLAKGLSIGFAVAFIPIPFQMVVAAFIAIYLDANVPIAVLGVWITNPITMTPIFYFCYWLGSTILGTNATSIVATEPGIMHSLLQIWQPLLLGCSIMATLGGIVGYSTVHVLWPSSPIWNWIRKLKSGEKK